MSRPTFDSVDEYLRAQPPDSRRRLTEVRRIIRKALPDADEVISYQIPGYRLGGRVAVYFAGFKDHYSVYPLTESATRALRDELEGYELSGRGTVRFPISRPVPSRLIAKLAKFLADERGGKPAAAKKKSSTTKSKRASVRP